MEWFPEFIAKYWLQVLLGLIVTGISTKYKRIKTWFEKIKQDQEEKRKKERIDEVKQCVNELKPMLEEIAKQSADGDIAIRGEMSDLATQVQILKRGVLAIQGDSFKRRCYQLMKDMDNGKFITAKTFESLRHDHNAYNALGGNSDGDELYSVFTHRYENQQIGK